MATRDYSAVESEYIAGELSIDALADLRDIPRGTLRRVSTLGDWVAKRDNYRAKMSNKTLEYAEQNELTARAMAGRATQRAFEDFAALPSDERGKRFPELLRLWAAMTGETTDRSATRNETIMTDAELEQIASGGSGAGTVVAPARALAAD